MSRPAIAHLYPLSPAQHGLLAQELVSPESGHYVVQFVATMRGPLDLEAFRDAWSSAQGRHGALRSSFVWESVAEPLQIVHRTAPLPFACEQAGGTEWLERFLRHQRRQPFRLKRAPLFSVTLARVSADTHYLVWCYHHLLLDGWSSAIILREVFGEYAAIVSGRRRSLEPPAGYERYVQWLRSQDVAACKRFWRGYLDGVQPPPAKSKYHAAHPASGRLLLSGDLQRRLDAYLRAEHITTSTLVHGVWSLLLARRTATRDVVFGSVVSGRPDTLPGADAVVGLLINVLPFRARIRNDVPASVWLRNLQRELGEARQFGSVPLGKIASWAASPGATLFDSILTIENYPDALWRAGGADGSLRISDVHFVESTGYSLTLEAVPAERLLLQVLFDRRRVHADGIESLLDEAREVIESLVGAPDQRLDRLLRRPSTVSEPLPVSPIADDTLTSRWTAAAAAHATSVAVECDGATMTYRELDDRAGKVAAALGRLSVQADEPVVLFLDRSLDLVAGIVGVLKASACFVPIEPSTPSERVSLVLEDTGTRVVITTTALASGLDLQGKRCVCVDALDAAPDQAIEHEAPRVLADQAAYVIYTSGSTGRPKGVMVTHRNVVRLFDATAHWFRFGADDVWTQFHSYAFDFSIWEIFGAILHGGRLVVVPRAITRSPDQFLCLLRDSRVTVLNLTPSAFRMLAMQESENDLTDLPLRLVIFGGESLSFNALTSWFARCGSRPALVNMYGITETTVHVTYRPIDALDPELVAGGRIGVAIPDLAVHLLDAAGSPASDGAAGEICVSGAGLARGYRGDARLTAQRFVPNPFGTQPGERLYRSGDLGRRLADGDLEYLGRIDRQLKNRGFRIEPGEIESALRCHPAVEDAVVIQRHDAAEPTVAAYVVPALREAAPVRRLIAAAARVPDTSLYELPNNTAVLHRHSAETEMMFDEIVRSSSYLRHGIELRDGDCMFDVGANIGLFTLHAHTSIPDLTIYAFEPIAEIYEILEHNFQSHGVAGRTFNLALGSRDAVEEFTYFPHVSVVSGRGVDTAKQQALIREYLRQSRGDIADPAILEELLADRLVSQQVSCRVRPLSAVFRALSVDRIDLLKVDVEGAEEDVLEGIDSEDWPKIGQAVLEVHELGSLRRLEALLARRGFTTVTEQQEHLRDTPLWMLYAVAQHRRRASARRPRVEPRTEWRSPARLVDELRAHLAARLPEYMRPHSVALIDSIPLTANGKIDESALVAPRALASASDGEKPRTAVEQMLHDIWKELFGLTTVGTDVSFFALGGDSILAVQMVSRVRRAGWRLTPAQVFELQTVANLARVAVPGTAAPTVSRPPSGIVPLTPVQCWFFEQRVPNRHYWNQAVMFELLEDLSPDALEVALQAVAGAHDAFRLRFEERDGVWRQECATSPGAIPLVRYPVDQEADALAAMHRGLNLTTGPVLRAAHIASTPDRPARLVLVAHHLVIDAVSWRIVVEDLMMGARDVAAGRAIQMAPTTATFQQWSEWLGRLAGDPRVESEVARYFESLARPTPSLPQDVAGGSPTEASTAEVSVSLSSDETNAVIERIARPSRSRASDIVLAAVAVALARWTRQTHVRIDVESHGRPLQGDIDASRSVGWFTNLFPIVLGAGDASDLRSLLRTVKEALALVPVNGVSYGLLRYLSAREIGHKWASLPAADVSFNFLGEFRRSGRGSVAVRLLDESVGALHDPDAMRPHLLAIEAAIADGCLQLTWSYSDVAHERRTIERLASSTLGFLRRMTAEATYTGQSLLSPTDFALADVTSAELDALMSVEPRVEDIYRLSPAQQGLLFHALYEPESTIYFTQFTWTFKGDLDIGALQESWRAVMQRHPALRTAFVYQGLRQPHQVVCADVDLSIEQQDWRALDPQDADARWAAFLQEQRARPFDVSRAPLMRLALVRTGDREHRFVWNHHHILFDGWCTGIILADLFGAYQALASGAPLPASLRAPARPYRDYLAWLARQDDLAAAEAFWRERLENLGSVAPLFGVGPAAGVQGAAIASRVLSPPHDRLLRNLARSRGLTLNTFVVGAWAIVLSHRSGSRQVLFGSTVAGRPPGLDGSDQIVGLFINTLPVPVDVAPDVPLLEWLIALQQFQVAARQYEHVSLSQIQRWRGASKGAPFLETAVVFENLPEFSVQRRSLPGLTVTDVGSFVRNHFAFTIRAVPTSPLRLDALFDPHRAPDGADELIEELENVLLHFVEFPEARVGDVSAMLMTRRAAVLVRG